MIEAIKSSIAAQAALKSGIEQSSAARSFTADPERTASTPAPSFVSPTVRVDNSTKIAILEFKESDTGEVVMQVPSERQISAYKQREVREKAEILTALSRRPELAGGAKSQIDTISAPDAASSSASTAESVESAYQAPQKSAAPVEVSRPEIKLSAPKVTVTTTGIDA